MDNCLFCKIIKKEIAAEIVLDTQDCLAFKDINPVAPHHYLVIPKTHFASITEIDAKISAALIEAIQELAKNFELKDFRTVLNTGVKAGQTVFHVHAHVIAGRRLEWPPG
jgi:histidine triad (HIT) family protein